MQNNKLFFQSVLVILLANILTACELVSEKKTEQPAMNVIELIIEGDYTQARSRANNNPDQLKQVEKVIANYETALPKKLDHHINNQRWEEVNQLLKQAEHRIPDSPVLKKEKNRWQTIQQKEQQHLETQRLIAESEALYANLTVDQQLLRIDPENRAANQRLKGFRKKTKTMAEKLLQTGKQALVENDLTLAQKTLPLALQLNSTSESRAANHALEDILTQQQQEIMELKQQSLAQQKRQQFKQLTNKLIDALAKAELAQAITLVKRAEAINKNSEKLQSLKQQLQKKIDQAVEKYLEQGIKHYRQDQFAEAIDDWNQVLKVEPNNKQAQINILRAEQVLSSLERLIEKRE